MSEGQSPSAQQEGSPSTPPADAERLRRSQAAAAEAEALADSLDSQYTRILVGRLVGSFLTAVGSAASIVSRVAIPILGGLSMTPVGLGAAAAVLSVTGVLVNGGLSLYQRALDRSVILEGAVDVGFIAKDSEGVVELLQATQESADRTLNAATQAAKVSEEVAKTALANITSGSSDLAVLGTDLLPKAALPALKSAERAQQAALMAEQLTSSVVETPAATMAVAECSAALPDAAHGMLDAHGLVSAQGMIDAQCVMEASNMLEAATSSSACTGDVLPAIQPAIEAGYCSVGVGGGEITLQVMGDGSEALGSVVSVSALNASMDGGAGGVSGVIKWQQLSDTAKELADIIDINADNTVCSALGTANSTAQATSSAAEGAKTIAIVGEGAAATAEGAAVTAEGAKTIAIVGEGAAATAEGAAVTAEGAKTIAIVGEGAAVTAEGAAATAEGAAVTAEGAGSIATAAEGAAAGDVAKANSAVAQVAAKTASASAKTAVGAAKVSETAAAMTEHLKSLAKSPMLWLNVASLGLSIRQIVAVSLELKNGPTTSASTALRMSAKNMSNRPPQPSSL